MNRINWNMRKLIGVIATILIVFLTYIPQAEAANFFLVPASSAVYVGSTFYVYLKVNSSEMASNSYSAVVTFDTNYLEPVSVLKSGSICTLFVAEPSIGAGSASVTCGLPSPGYQGGNGNLIILNLRAKKIGTTSLGVSSGAILANDGFGTNILRSSNGTSVRIIAATQPDTTQQTEPEKIDVAAPEVTSNRGESGEWIAEDSINFTWNKPKNAKGYSYSMSRDKDARPPNKSLTTGQSKAYSDLDDGTWYFRIRGVNGDNYSPITTFVIRIDTTGPEKFDVALEPSGDEVITTIPILGFAAVDNGSGVEKYQMKLDDGTFVDVTNPHIFSQISSGDHTVIMRAIDMVGNYTDKEITFSIIEFEAPTITNPVDFQIINSTDGVMIEGTATPNSSVLIYINDELIGTAQSDENGLFAFNLNRSLPGGEYAVSAQIKTDGGILGSMSESVSFTIEESLLPVDALSIFGDNTPYVYAGCCLSLLLLLVILILVLWWRRRSKEEDESKDKNSVSPRSGVSETSPIVQEKKEEEILPQPVPVISPKKAVDTTHEPLDNVEPVGKKPIEESVERPTVSDRENTDDAILKVGTAASVAAVATQEKEEIDTDALSAEGEKDATMEEEMKDDDKKTKDAQAEIEKLEIEKRIAEAKLEIDQHLHDVERKLREEIEKDPTQTRESEHRLEHAVTEAIDQSEDFIDEVLDPEKLVDGQGEEKEPEAEKSEEAGEETDLIDTTPHLSEIIEDSNDKDEDGGLSESLKKEE